MSDQLAGVWKQCNEPAKWRPKGLGVPKPVVVLSTELSRYGD